MCMCYNHFGIHRFRRQTMALIKRVKRSGITVLAEWFAVDYYIVVIIIIIIIVTPPNRAVVSTRTRAKQHRFLSIITVTIQHKFIDYYKHNASMHIPSWHAATITYRSAKTSAFDSDQVRLNQYTIYLSFGIYTRHTYLY